MSIEKENFLRTRLVKYLQQIDPDTSPLWGKMNVQQMIEHYGASIMNANGRLKFDTIATPPDMLDKIREFLMSDKPFRENTKNPILPEDPGPLRYKTVQGAIGALQQELIYFFQAFEANPNLVTRNPIFGDLNFEQNVQLLHKHALHHLRQFGITPLTV